MWIAPAEHTTRSAAIRSPSAVMTPVATRPLVEHTLDHGVRDDVEVRPPRSRSGGRRQPYDAGPGAAAQRRPAGRRGLSRAGPGRPGRAVRSVRSRQVGPGGSGPRPGRSSPIRRTAVRSPPDSTVPLIELDPPSPRPCGYGRRDSSPSDTSSPGQSAPPRGEVVEVAEARPSDQRRSGLDQRHVTVRILAQPGRDHASRRPAADHEPMSHGTRPDASDRSASGGSGHTGLRGRGTLMRGGRRRCSARCASGPSRRRPPV